MCLRYRAGCDRLEDVAGFLLVSDSPLSSDTDVEVATAVEEETEGEAAEAAAAAVRDGEEATAAAAVRRSHSRCNTERREGERKEGSTTNPVSAS
jgi:hypothetical protein